MTRWLYLTAPWVLLCSACPISGVDASPFGRSCSVECPEGYHCNATDVCVPGPPPVAPTIDSFVLDADDVRPETAVTASWSTTGASTCALQLDENEPRDVDVNGDEQLSAEAGGDHQVTLSCESEGGEAKATASFHVRFVAPSLNLATQDDVDNSVAVEEVDGDVVFTGTVTGTAELQVRVVHGSVRTTELAGLVSLELAQLESIGGDLIVRANEALTQASFPELTTVGGELFVAAELGQTARELFAFEEFDAPKLETVGGAVALSAYEYVDLDGDGHAEDPSTPSESTLPFLSTISLTSLRTVGGSFRVEEADALGQLRLPSIESIEGALVFFGNDNLTAVDWPVTRLGAGAVFDRNPKLGAVKFGQLQAMGTTREVVGDAYELAYAQVLPSGCTDERYRVGDLFFIENEADGNICLDSFDSDTVETLDLTSLVTVEGRLLIAGLGLSTLALPSLQSAGGITLRRNGVLVSASFPLLETVGADGLLLDNDDNLDGFAALTTIEGDLSLYPSTLPEFTSLTDIGGSFALDYLEQVELLRFPALARVGHLSLDATQSGSITQLVLPSLVHADVLELRGAFLSTAELCGLTSVDTLTILGTGITTLDGFASLTSANTLGISNHAGLAQCVVDALVEQTGATNATSSTGNNGVPPAPCAITNQVCGGP